MNSVQTAEKDHLGTKNTSVCPAPLPPNSIPRRKFPAAAPAGTAKMHLNPLVCKKIRRDISLKRTPHKPCPSADDKTRASINLCGGAFGALKFSHQENALSV